MLVTKGDLLHQETKLAASGLGSRFAAVEIVSDKTASTYARVFAAHGVAPERALMAGDSLRSDVLPALEAGAFAAHVPHGVPWSHERAAEPDHPRYRRLAALADLPGWIDAIGGGRLELPPLASARGRSSGILFSRASSHDRVTSPDRDLL